MMRRQVKIAAASLTAATCLTAWVGWVDAAKPNVPWLGQETGHNVTAVGFEASIHPTEHLAVGVASCAAAACHGGDSSEISVRSAYSRWKSRDPHARAGEVLYGPLALSMAAILQSTGAMPKGEKAAASPMCIQCHGSPSKETHGGFTAEEGVACEQCHGPASSYLDKHFEPFWRTLDSAGKASYGMTDTKNLAVRADACVKCHQGGPGYEVTHDMIAAGHPLLRFDFRTYMAHYPGKHWNNDVDHDAHGRRSRGEAPFDLAAWVIGQQASAKAAAELTIHRGSRGHRATDFAEADCTACHQNLMKQPSPSASRLGSIGWFGWQASGLKLSAPESADAFTAFARSVSSPSANPMTWRPKAAEVQSAKSGTVRQAPLLPQLKRLLDFPAIEREGWEAALQRRLAAQAMVAAARETYLEEAWAVRRGIAPAMEKLRRATAAWQEFRAADVVAAWKALEESLNAARDD